MVEHLKDEWVSFLGYYNRDDINIMKMDIGKLTIAQIVIYSRIFSTLSILISSIINIDNLILRNYLLILQDNCGTTFIIGSIS